MKPPPTRVSDGLESPRSRQVGRENAGEVARKFVKKGSQDDCPYENIEHLVILLSLSLSFQNYFLIVRLLCERLLAFSSLKAT